MKNDLPEVAHLVSQIKGGNSNAFEQLVRKYHKIFCEKAFWVLKDADLAKDIAQESWKTILNHIGDLKDDKQFASWALRIVCNKSFDELRKQKRTRKLSDVHITELETSQPNINEETTVLETLHKAMQDLPIDHQQVLRLFYLESYSIFEISNILRIPKGTVKSRLFHSRESLKAVLKKSN